MGPSCLSVWWDGAGGKIPHPSSLWKVAVFTPLLALFAQVAPDADAAAQAVPDGITTGEWIRAGVVFVVAIVIGLVASKTIKRTMVRRSPDAAPLVGRLSGLILVLVGFVYALSSIGVQVGLFVGALGIGGVALAFAFQDILENFMAGIILQVKRPFRTGDIVQLGDLPHLGVLRNIDSRSVVLDTFGGERIVLPAANVLKTPIENWTVNRRRRLAVPIGVSYRADPVEACRVITERVQQLTEVLQTPAPRTLLDEFDDSSVNLVCYVWHDAFGDIFHIKHRVMQEAKLALDDAGIEIPFPQRVLSFGPSDDRHDTNGHDNGDRLRGRQDEWAN